MNKPNFGSPELLFWDLRGVWVSQATKLSQATHDPSAAAFVTHTSSRGVIYSEKIRVLELIFGSYNENRV